MIDIQGLYKRYHRQHRVYDWVLEDLNLLIPARVSVGLLGRNGAGKSTLLRLIAGMDHPDRGVVRRLCRVSWPIGLSGGFQGSMSARQNVKFVARVHGGRYDVDDIIQKVQDFAELGDSFDEPIKTYSSGMRARLNFGLSLAFDFDVYLSDEATAVGDRAFREKATRAFKDKVGQASLIMVSHSEGILKELCQAGIYLKDGRATWYDDIEEAIAAYHAETDGLRLSDGGAGRTSSKRRRAASATSSAPAEIDLPVGLTLGEAEQQLLSRKAELDAARAKFEQAKADDLPPHALKPLRQSLTLARERLHDARRRVQALKSTHDDD